MSGTTDKGNKSAATAYRNAAKNLRLWLKPRRWPKRSMDDDIFQAVMLLEAAAGIVEVLEKRK